MAVLTKQVKVLLSNEQYKHLQKMANDRKESMASLIRKALSNMTVQTEDHIIDKQKKRLRDYEFFGMWKDRDDMKDSAEWVRKQRKNWDRRIMDGKENDNH
ncbi:MAG: hypothetical protein AAB116_13735 [Candidatus Poribacteria bacterium]